MQNKITFLEDKHKDVLAMGYNLFAKFNEYEVFIGVYTSFLSAKGGNAKTKVVRLKLN